MKVFNTLSGGKEDFSPRGDGVRMYVCGITPYSEAHIGHAMSYIIFDAIRRYLQFRGYRVEYIQNITDIDDKIIDRANNLGVSASELAEKYTASFFEDMDNLNVSRANKYPRATEEIPKIIEVIGGLVAKGYAYPAQGSVYFRISKVADYGKLSGRRPESMMAGARIEADKEKEQAMDFVLWKASKPAEPSWPSPWGPGRPGWHIECSAMSLKYLGDTIDIHGGGQDLIFPHHENEIAQSESFTGKKPFVSYWLHNGLLRLGEEKMSKSLGNLITIKEALDRFSPDAIRIFVLGSHYRSPLTYSEDALEAAEGGADRLRQAVWAIVEGKQTGMALDIESYREKFRKAMDDDFGTPQALATLFDLAREINRVRDEGYNSIPGQRLLKELAGVLGLTIRAWEWEGTPLSAETFGQLIDIRDELRQMKQGQITDSIRAKLDEGGIVLENTSLSAKTFIDHLVSIRDAMRQEKLWQQADTIRNRLIKLGIVLEDTPEGTVTIWKRRR